MGCELSGEGQVVEPGDAEDGLVNSVAFKSAVSEDLPVLQPREGVFDPCAGLAVDGVLCFLLWAEVALASSFAVRDEETSALVAAVRDGGGRPGRPGRRRTP
ncbi:hypothetical protein ATE80_13845 [Streptomyces kanasensis]|uniref:Uncharacterized protein n=1 Tax=Streptomyces kanasensis TaxID=936756 RepID=A0A100Y5V0_9ACTN|nr:hypothetical protein ATE80_13845 [Streptomyces kanasensis]